MSREDRPAEFTVCLPDGRPINAYTDTHGRVVTRDGSAPGGPPRLFHDLFMEAVPRSRRRDGPQPPRLPDSLVVPNSARELQESDVFYSEQLLDTISLKESSVTTTSSSSPQAVAVAHDTIEVSPPSGRLSLGSPILSRIPYGWHLVFFIGIDRGGSFHIYPHIGGPYQSLEDADNAITCHLDDRREKNVCLDGLSRMEINVRRALYLPDGTRRKLSKSYTAQESHKNTCLLVQALLDKYNEDHNLKPAYELKDVICIQSICEGRPHKWYYHLNFTARTKGEDVFHSGIDSLFFAEITRIGGAYKEFALSCLYMLKPNDNGHCRGCTNNGSVNLKHPNEADEYTGGHLDAYLPRFFTAGC
ncbi:unnamed protein product [Alopecurus aequalis]